MMHKLLISFALAVIIVFGALWMLILRLKSCFDLSDLPSAEDLDAIAEEERIRKATGGNPQ